MTDQDLIISILKETHREDFADEMYASFVTLSADVHKDEDPETGDITFEFSYRKQDLPNFIYLTQRQITTEINGQIKDYAYEADNIPVVVRKVDLANDLEIDYFLENDKSYEAVD